MPKTPVINLSESFANTEAAMDRLRLEIKTMDRLGMPYAKVRHGVAMNPEMGTLINTLRVTLRQMKDEGTISTYFGGEKFGPFDSDVRKALRMCPDLRRDEDWARRNREISVVILKKFNA